MSLPPRIQRNVEDLLKDVTTLLDRLETEPDAVALIDPLKRLHSELQSSFRSVTPPRAKSIDRTEPLKPKRPQGGQIPLLFARPKASRPINPPPSPRQPAVKVAPTISHATPAFDWDPPPLAPKSKWRRLLIERTVGKFLPAAMLVFEEIDRGKEPDDCDFRVWCRELLEGEPWSYVPDAFWDNGFVKLDFPPHLYKRMPARLALTMLKAPHPGATLRMLSEDGRPFTTFTIREVDMLTATQVGKAEATLLV